MQFAREPYLHLKGNEVYNPLTDKTLRVGDSGYEEIVSLTPNNSSLEELPEVLRKRLLSEGWLVSSKIVPSERFYLQYAEVETNSYCNQSCYFCPVSESPRPRIAMTTAKFNSIISELSEYRNTLKIVMLFRYNEPSVEKRLVELVSVVNAHELPPGINTNATGLSPEKTDSLIKAGGLRYLSVNLSTLDRQQYAEERGGDHLQNVLRNLDYIKDSSLAEIMDLAVLGRGDEVHLRNFEEISNYFGDSQFNIKKFEVMDRAGNVQTVLNPESPPKKLCGCEQSGSRPLQWIHITPDAKCVLCCQDYHENYVIGDLSNSSIFEVLTGSKMAQMRRWLYGEETAPEDFICRKCIFARRA